MISTTRAGGERVVIVSASARAVMRTRSQPAPSRAAQARRGRASARRAASCRGGRLTKTKAAASDKTPISRVPGRSGDRRAARGRERAWAGRDGVPREGRSGGSSPHVGGGRVLNRALRRGSNAQAHPGARPEAVLVSRADRAWAGTRSTRADETMMGWGHPAFLILSRPSCRAPSAASSSRETGRRTRPITSARSTAATNQTTTARTIVTTEIASLLGRRRWWYPGAPRTSPGSVPRGGEAAVPASPSLYLVRCDPRCKPAACRRRRELARRMRSSCPLDLG